MTHQPLGSTEVDGNKVANFEGKRTKDAVDHLLTCIPENETWEMAAGEPYGPENILPEAIAKRVLYCVTITTEVEELFSKGVTTF